jgi:hypothetical protein
MVLLQLWHFAVFFSLSQGCLQQLYACLAYYSSGFQRLMALFAITITWWMKVTGCLEKIRDCSPENALDVGMSGGLKSSTAAALLVEQGYDVIGVTLELWKQDCLSPAQDQLKCCGSRAAADLCAVLTGFGNPFHPYPTSFLGSSS